MQKFILALCALITGSFVFLSAGIAVASMGASQQQQQQHSTALHLEHHPPELPWHEALDFASKGNETVIVTVASYSHRLNLLNWLAMVNRARGTVSDVLIVCMDYRIAAWIRVLGKDCAVVTTLPEDASRWRMMEGVRCVAAYLEFDAVDAEVCKEKCVEEGAKCHAASFSASAKLCSLCHEAHSTVSDPTHRTNKRQRLSPLFKMRVRLLHHFAASTPPRNVLLSDLDAFWLTDPLPELKAANSDIVATRGSHPRKLSERWGATICMGFIYLRSSKHLAGFLTSVVSEADFTGDDQEGFNIALMSADVMWNERLLFDKSTAIDYGATTSGFRVALLPHETYRRRCESGEGLRKAVVVHCYDKGVGKSNTTHRIARAQERGLWLLRHEWRDLPVVPPIDAFLDTISLRDIPIHSDKFVGK